MKDEDIRQAFEETLFIGKIELNFIKSGKTEITHSDYLSILELGFSEGCKSRNEEVAELKLAIEGKSDLIKSCNKTIKNQLQTIENMKCCGNCGN
jgi:hypothetical protein